MDTELEILEALKDIARTKVEAEAAACGAAPALSGRKSWLEFKRQNSKAWSQAAIETHGSHLMKNDSQIHSHFPH